MRLEELVTPDKLLAVVYGGRFQPFHLGHYQVWSNLISLFGEQRVWLTTSNATNLKVGPDSSPLTFNEKRELIVGLYGIPYDRVVKSKNPAFMPTEVLQLYKGPTVLVLVVGSKDKARFEGNKLFYAPYPTAGGKPKRWEEVKDSLKPVNGQGESVTYYLVDDSLGLAGTGAASATDIRSDLLKASDEQYPTLFKRFFGKWDPQIGRMIISKLKMIK